MTFKFQYQARKFSLINTKLLTPTSTKSVKVGELYVVGPLSSRMCKRYSQNLGVYSQIFANYSQNIGTIFILVYQCAKFMDYLNQLFSMLTQSFSTKNPFKLYHWFHIFDIYKLFTNVKIFRKYIFLGICCRLNEDNNLYNK